MAVLFAQYPGGMMVHVLWFPTRIQGGVGMPTHGVRIISSTPASNTGGYLHMAVHDVPGMFPSNVFGPHAGGVFVGTLGTVYPPPRQVGPLPEEAAQYVMAVNRGISIYRAYAGYSLQYPDLSNQYHALDFYWQDPGMLGSGVYHHYILEDVVDPVAWYEARRIRMLGHFRMEDSVIRAMPWPTSRG